MSLWEQRKSHAVGTSGSGAAAIDRAVAELAGTYPPASKPPLLVAQPATLARSRSQGSLGLALLAGAGVALVGGLLWAAVVIATRWDIGIVAWLVGAATGATIVRVFGGPVPGTTKVGAGLMAAGAIVVGKYVIFVHDAKKALGALLAQRGLSIGYLDTRPMSVFIHHFGSIVEPIYGLWLLCAFAAAVRAGGGPKKRTHLR